MLLTQRHGSRQVAENISPTMIQPHQSKDAVKSAPVLATILRALCVLTLIEGLKITNTPRIDTFQAMGLSGAQQDFRDLSAEERLSKVICLVAPYVSHIAYLCHLNQASLCVSSHPM